jgi:hypothetical protein
MSQSIILKRSALPGKVPDTGSLNLGEIAINTYDGKVFLKRSGSVESIQSLITTNSITTGSITLTQSGSFGELVVTQDANITRDLFIGRDIVSNGDIDILGDITGSNLLIRGNIVAQQLIISSSVTNMTTQYASGSTSFGDTLTDTHRFTGSVSITGSLTLNGNDLGQATGGSGSFTGSFSGSFIGDGGGLTNINLDTELPRNGYDYNIEDVATINDFNSTSTKYIIDFRNEFLVGTPVGQITYIANQGGDSQLIPGNDKIYLISGDAEVGYITSEGYDGNIVGIGNPATFSASIDYRFNTIGASALPAGVISGSSQISALGFISSSTSTPVGTISSSAQITSLGFISSSTDITSLNTFTASQSTASLVNRLNVIESISGSWITESETGSFLTNLNGAISSSSQLTASFDLRYLVTGSVTSSINQLNIFTASVVLTSSFNSYTASISTGSLATTASLNLFTASAATTGSNTFRGTETITGSLLVSGSTTFTGSISISSGSITMPNRPAFRVTGAGGAKVAVTPLTGSYLNVDYQQGGGWDNTTGTFTAPIAGLYQVNVVVRTNSNSLGTISQLIVYKNYTGLGTGTPQIMVEFGTNTTMNHAGGSTISKLAAGDTLKMVVAVGEISFDQNDNFSVAYIG